MSTTHTPPTEEQIKELGFECASTYKHDEYKTRIYCKGVLQVEFTYKGKKLVTCDACIAQVRHMSITYDDIAALTPILGDCTDWKEF